MLIKRAWDSFLSLLFPDICIACENVLINQEFFICTACNYHLPINDHHVVQRNAAYQRLLGKSEIDMAWSYLSFTKNSRTQKLIHSLKYHRAFKVGEIFGIKLGKQILTSHYYTEIDLIVPIPIHKSKLRNRSYNQSDFIAQGLAIAIGKPINNTDLVRLINTQSQTEKGRLDRYDNVLDVFSCINTESFKGKHILLVDDVLTTGATMAAAANTLLEACDCKVSVATLAIA